jgi:uncharacterized protein YdbL (DUF1318 family)
MHSFKRKNNGDSFMFTVLKYLTVFFATLFFACSIKTPEVSITGEKTALEEQVLGDYRQIESDAWVIASTRAAGSGRSGGKSQQQILAATQNRKFNKDEVDEFKKDKTLGENNQGYLEILFNDKYDTESIYRKMVDQLLAEENRDRKIIYEQIIAAQNINSQEKRDKIQIVFAKQNIKESASGTMIQDDDGNWVEKD